MALYSCCVTLHRSDSQFHHLFQGDNCDVIYHRTGTSSAHRHTHHVTDNARFSLHFSDFRLELWHYILFFLHQSQDSVTSSTLKVKVQSGVHESKNTITQVITEIITTDPYPAFCQIPEL